MRTSQLTPVLEPTRPGCPARKVSGLRCCCAGHLSCEHLCRRLEFNGHRPRGAQRAKLCAHCVPSQVMTIREEAALQGIWGLDFRALRDWCAQKALANTLADMCGNAFSSSVRCAVCLAVFASLIHIDAATVEDSGSEPGGRPLQRLGGNQCRRAHDGSPNPKIHNDIQ